MTRNQRHTAVLLLVLTVLTVSAVWAGNKKKKDSSAASNALSPRQRATHALNRLTFGPRPGDVDRVMATGIDNWIELQLHPEKIDDSVLTARLAPLRTLNMDTRQMVMAFPPRQLVKAVQMGRVAMPSDPAERAIYQAQMQRMDQKQEQAQNAAQQDGDDNSISDQQKAAKRQAREFAEQAYQQLMAESADQRMTTILAMSPDQRDQFASGLRPNERMEMLQSLSPEHREQVMALRNPEAVVVTELQQGKILRAAYSERQLEQVMTDFWFNHFNVFVNKGPDRYLTTAYERDVIRPHAMGKFKDLLIATAKSPALLWYLDNWDSVGPNSEFARNGGRRPRQFRRGGFGRPPMFQQNAEQKA
ncbi:MAG: DUF1800 family protein, partial [Terriglobales bacterium]